jgi:uncharacterized membrane protein YraQ (UPF0718 family)
MPHAPPEMLLPTTLASVLARFGPKMGMILIVALVAAALVVGITLLQQERRSMRGVDPDYIESLRQENRRLANLLEEYLLENKAISLNDQDLLERTVKELSHHRKRKLGR